jgi:hypothetical protein
MAENANATIAPHAAKLYDFDRRVGALENNVLGPSLLNRSNQQPLALPRGLLSEWWTTDKVR